jgi:hypothetical protein
MSSISLASPASPALHRDIRAASLPFKRDKDHDSKWSQGTRPSGGVTVIGVKYPIPSETVAVGESPSQREKVRPGKQLSQMQVPSISFQIATSDNSPRRSDYKPHANKTPKPTAHAAWAYGPASNRLSRKLDAQMEANSTFSDISSSLLELIPHHALNSSSSIQTAIRASADEGILYSFETSGASPTKKGRALGLGGLVEKAEEKFLDEQTERMVKEDYEVLDVEGESVILKTEKKRKASPKQKAAKIETKIVEEDDGFELI